MHLKNRMNIALLCTASIVALSSASLAQTANDPAGEVVVVTGSRTISDAANSPTPLTIASTAQLEMTTPTNIADALNKLPEFQGGVTQRQNPSGSSVAQNSINLRNFGANRTLVLLDGHRVTPTNTNNTVDIDVLPQLLMSRVDVVTGGVSAVYGSDAVTGVVNFILNKNLEGVKYDMSGGISSQGDAPSYKAGIAAGTDLLGGRAHIEGSFETYYSGGILMTARKYGLENWGLGGAGTAASPFRFVPDARTSTVSDGGIITCSGCGTLSGMQFISNGVVGPFNPGVPTGVNGLQSGGDGFVSQRSTLSATLRRQEGFFRASYNVDDTTVVYANLEASQVSDSNSYFPAQIRPGTLFFSNNPYLPASVSAQMTQPTFSLSSDIANHAGIRTDGLYRLLQGTVGADGTIFDHFDWDVFYTHGDSRAGDDDPETVNSQKLAAASDAVLNSSHQVVCYVSTVAALAALYPGCQPINPFGPSAVSDSAYKYIVSDARYVIKQSMDDVGGSIAGNVVDLPAGPLKAALSAEYRVQSLRIDSNSSGNILDDCSNLRLCVPGRQLYDGHSLTSVPTVSESVWEGAAEVDVPLLKDLPLVQSLSTNLAGRYTDYSVSGSVETWKIGLDWHVSDDVRFRGTNSIDIRAPTLFDLFGAPNSSVAQFADLLTNTIGRTTTTTGSNPDLVPEVARTETGGVVFTPTFIPGLTTSVDFYNINIHNAITSISGGTNAVQQICNASGGSSPYCALYVRPLPYSNTTSANYPSAVLTEQLNSAFNVIQGIDVEVNYHFDMADIDDSLVGSTNLRLLASNQAKNETTYFPGAPVVIGTAPKTNISIFANYNVGNWGVNLLDRWISGFPATAWNTGLVYTVPRLHSENYVDVTLDRKLTIGETTTDAYLSVQNVFNTKSQLDPTNSATPRLVYPASPYGGLPGVIGTFFTIGIRGNI